jgi:hypothetical protein
MTLDAGTLRMYLQARGAVALREIQQRADRLALTARLADEIPLTEPGLGRPEGEGCGYCGCTSELELAAAPEPGFAERFCIELDGCMARRERRFPSTPHPLTYLREKGEAAQRDLDAIRFAVAAYAEVDLPAEELRLTRQAERARRPAAAPRTLPVASARPAPAEPAIGLTSPARPAMRPIGSGRRSVRWAPAKPEPGRHRKP